LLEALGVADLASGIYVGAVVFAAYLVRGIAGFGSGLIAVPLLSMVAPVPAVVPLVVSLDYMGSASQGVHNVDRVAWRDQLALVPFMAGGVGAGLYLLSALSSAALGRALGGFILLYAVYQWLPLPALRGPRLFAAPCGVLGGLVGTVFGTGGPFYVIYLNLRALERTAFRATFAVNYLIDGGIRLGAYVAMGLLGGRTLTAIALTLPVAAAGLYLGGRLQTGFSQAAFVRFISLLLIGSGLVLLLRS
jgi:uncharacterized membrane protein YfcA